jgi:hypothetical protein
VFLFMALLVRFLKMDQKLMRPIKFQNLFIVCEVMAFSKANMKVKSQGHVPVSQHYVKEVDEANICLHEHYTGRFIMYSGITNI